MAIDNLSLSPVRVATPSLGAVPLASNTSQQPTIGSDTLALSDSTALLANAKTVAASNTAAVNSSAAATNGIKTADVKTADVKTADTTNGTYTVQPGDTLSGIAQAQLGDASRWPEIFQANQDQIKDPNLIYPGQELNLPDATAAATIDTTPADTTPVDLSTADAPVTASVPAAAPTRPVIKQPIPRDFPPYDVPRGLPTRCFPLPRPQAPSLDRDAILRQKLELLTMERQVVQLELQLDKMLGQLDRQQPQPRFGAAIN